MVHQMQEKMEWLQGIDLTKQRHRIRYSFAVRNSLNNAFYFGTSGIVVYIAQALYPAEFKGKSRLTYFFATVLRPQQFL